MVDIIAAADAHEGLAAWVQAGGSLIALWVAIYLPFRVERNRRLAELKSTLGVVTSAIFLMGHAIQAAKNNDDAKAQHRVIEGSDWRIVINALDKMIVPGSVASASIVQIKAILEREFTRLLNASQSTVTGPESEAAWRRELERTEDGWRLAIAVHTGMTRSA
jgi:hypothetical protein